MPAKWRIWCQSNLKSEHWPCLRSPLERNILVKQAFRNYWSMAVLSASYQFRQGAAKGRFSTHPVLKIQYHAV
jgi:hypothetical protein